MGGTLEDLRYALRRLTLNPGFTAIAVLTLALGIGGSAAVFSVVNAALLRPLPGIAHPKRLVGLYRVIKTEAFGPSGYPNYVDFRDRSHSFAGLAAHSGTPLSFRYGAPELVRGDLVTGNYFQVLGTRPALGRLFAPEDDRAEQGHSVAVLSYGLWQRELGGARNVLGFQVMLNGYPFTVVGVAEREFTGTMLGDAFDIWVPLASQPQTLSRLSAGIMQDRAAGWLNVFGRLRSGVPFEQARAEIKTIAAQLARDYPETNGSRSADLVPGIGLYPEDRADMSRLMGLLSAAVGLLLLIACANVAGLFLAGALRRHREIAMRLAVGAGRRRIARQLLTEGLLLSLFGGALGLLLSAWAAELMAAIRTSSTLRHLDVHLDGPVLLFTLLISLMTGTLLALLPAWRGLPSDLTAALKEGAPGAGFRPSRARPALVVMQVGMGFLLVSAATLLARDLRRIVTSDPGYETHNVAMASLDLNIQRYPESRGLTVYRRLLERLPAIPGALSASLAGTVPPIEFPGRVSIFYPGQEPPQEVLRHGEMEQGLRVDINRIGPDYFRTLGIRLLRGRDFALRDGPSDRGVAIVNQRLAERLWPAQDPVGKRIAWPSIVGPPRAPLEVVGVAADTRSRSLVSAAPLLIYLPLLQNYDGRARIIVRTASDPRAALAGIARAVESIDKDVAVFGADTMDRYIAESLWQQRTAAGWIGTFSLLALALAAVGLYGVIAQSVAQRSREVAIRIALGAVPRSITGLVLRDAMRLAVAGLALGAAAALALAAVLRSSLTAGSAQDALSFLAAALLLVAVMLAASWIPARRAARVDPVAALRSE